MHRDHRIINKAGKKKKYDFDKFFQIMAIQSNQKSGTWPHSGNNEKLESKSNSEILKMHHWTEFHSIFIDIFNN